MTKRGTTVEVEVEHELPSTDEEVDEITERESVGEMVPIGLNPAHLDDFLREQFDTTATGEENGLPRLEWLRRHFNTKSAVIRYLHHKGHPVKLIAKHLGIRYQHVRNVLTVELKRGPNESWHITDDENGGISPGLTNIDQKF
jgi:hypothetical protein